MNVSSRFRFGPKVTLTIVAVALGCLAAPFASADQAGGEQHKPGQPATRSGAELYQHICQGCHMPDGRGAVGAGKYPALAGDVALAAKEFAALTLITGRRNMPSFVPAPDLETFFPLPKLDDEQIAAVVNYVRGNFGNHFKDSMSVAEVTALRESLQKH